MWGGGLLGAMIGVQGHLFLLPLHLTPSALPPQKRLPPRSSRSLVSSLRSQIMEPLAQLQGPPLLDLGASSASMRRSRASSGNGAMISSHPVDLGHNPPGPGRPPLHPSSSASPHMQHDAAAAAQLLELQARVAELESHLGEESKSAQPSSRESPFEWVAHDC
jgi:hypothetical protein